MNKLAVNTCGQVFFGGWGHEFCLGKYQEVQLLDPMVTVLWYFGHMMLGAD